MRLFASILFLFCAKFVFAQAEDSTELVIAPYDTTIYYEDEDEDKEEESDQPLSSSTYTKTPQELNSTKQELNKQYTEKKFSKTEWKKIVGETNYTEEPTAEEEESQYTGSSPAWDPMILKILGYLLIFALITAAIFFLFRNALLDKESVKSKLNVDPLFYETGHIDEVTESDLERLSREALERNDLRSAVRLYYIKLLKQLHSTGYIAWKKDKTNYDYAHELSSVSFILDFRRLMIAYEIIWYGERTPSPEEFKKLQSGFSDLHGQAARTS
jgi:hypothetical protein